MNTAKDVLRSLRFWGLLFCLSSCISGGSAHLAEAASPEIASPGTASPETAAALELKARIASTIDKLGAREFDVRQSASRDLQRIGGAAIPSLGEAALSQDRESRMRALDLLKIHSRGSDVDLSEQATAVLERLAEDKDHPAGRLAANILDNRLEKIRSQLQQQAQLAQRIRGQNINLQIRIAPGQRAQIPARPVRPAQNATIKISDNRRGKLQVQIANGQIKVLEVQLPDGTKKNYKTIKEVKEKHPDLFKRYESIAKRSGYPLPK